MRLWFPILMGVAGVAVLLGLGFWQLDRLGQKLARIAQIDAAILAEPVALPADPDPERDLFLPVTVTGALGGEEAPVLTSMEGGGPGFRVVSAMTAGDRRVLVDLGFVPEAERAAPRMAERVTVTGNLHWPEETDAYTPPPGDGLWFARDVGLMAEALGTEPVMVVARTIEGADLGTTPLPVTSAGVRNDHLGYAITWFSLAAVWAAMSGILLWRNRARPA